MSFPRQLGRATLFVLGFLIAGGVIVSVLSYPSEKERSIKRRNTLRNAAAMVQHRLSDEGRLPEEVTLIEIDGSEVRISVSPWGRRALSLQGNRVVRTKKSETNAFHLVYAWGNGDGVDTFDSSTGKSSLDDYPSRARRLLGACFFLSISYFCFRTAKAAYQGESHRPLKAPFFIP